MKLSTIHPNACKNEIYIRTNKPTKVYTKYIEKLFDKGLDCIIIHALGMAIPKALIVIN